MDKQTEDPKPRKRPSRFTPSNLLGDAAVNTYSSLYPMTDEEETTEDATTTDAAPTPAADTDDVPTTEATAQAEPEATAETESEAESPTPPQKASNKARPRITVDMPEWLQDEIRDYAEGENIGPSDAVCYLTVLGLRADMAGLGRLKKYNARSLKFAFHVDLDPEDLDKPLKT
jgi:hypothetical protein